MDQIKYHYQGSVDETMSKYFCISQTDQLGAIQVLPNTETHLQITDQMYCPILQPI